VLGRGGQRDVRKDLDATLASRDVTALSWSENGFRQLCNSQREVHKPGDMKGLKIRYAANPLYADIFTALGANPVQMSWADLQNLARHRCGRWTRDARQHLPRSEALHAEAKVHEHLELFDGCQPHDGEHRSVEHVHTRRSRDHQGRRGTDRKMGNQ
jgi:hypothetical protein